MVYVSTIFKKSLKFSSLWKKSVTAREMLKKKLIGYEDYHSIFTIPHPIFNQSGVLSGVYSNRDFFIGGSFSVIKKFNQNVKIIKFDILIKCIRYFFTLL